jgi:Salmonella virulence plasmid 65kDa B protein
MSKARSGAGPAVSLPSGGGAVSGLGETFAPDLHTGTGNLTVPIALPPGRGQLAPSLSLAYSTGHGNGPFGLGWALSVPRIARATSHGVPRYEVGDGFLLSGVEELVEVGGSPDGTIMYLQLAGPGGRTLRAPVHLRFVEQGGGGPAGGAATPIDGRVTTRTAGSWTSMLGRTPFGEWELSLPNTEAVRERFRLQQVEDILLVVSYSAATPPWPA